MLLFTLDDNVGHRDTILDTIQPEYHKYRTQL